MDAVTLFVAEAADMVRQTNEFVSIFWGFVFILVK
jgi:hypothetical protein